MHFPLLTSLNVNNRFRGNTDLIEECLDVHTSRVIYFAKRRVIRGRVISGFGGDEMKELLLILQVYGWTNLFLQGKTRKKMGRAETRQFYTCIRHN